METGDKVELKIGSHPRFMRVLVNDEDVKWVRSAKLESDIKNDYVSLTVEVIRPGGLEETYRGYFVSVEDWEMFRAWQRDLLK